MIDNLIGKTLGEYQIVALASRDGIATVYKAYQPSTKRYVALKVSPAGAAQDAEFVKRFRPEALAASRVKHPNLLVIYDAGQEGNLFYIAREYVEGQTLAQLVQRTGGLDTLRAAQIFAQIATALDVAHQRGLIHGDIKPDNILIGPNDQVKLTDLGIVKALAGAGAQIAGAPEYMSPEQIQGRPVDRRSDLYSLGVVLYQMLTGNVPFSGNTPQAIMDAHVNRAPTPPSRLTAFVAHPVDAVVMRALAKNPAERFASAQEMSVALSQAAAGLYAEATKPVPAPATPPAAPRPSRSALVPIVAGLGILALIAISVIIVISVILLGIARMNAARGIAAQVTSSATPAPAATATPTPTLTLTPSPVQPTPAASIPPLTPTSTPSPTRVEPTATPSPPPTATASTTQVSLAATATSRPGVLFDFETMGSWRRGDQPNGTLVQSTQHAHTGQASARLDYSFPTGSNDFVVFINPVTLYGQPNVISVWVYGDGSGHFLNAWIMDSGSQVWQVPLGRVGGAGWKQMAGSIATGQAWPWAHISGPDNGQVDYPISFYALVLDDNPDTFVGSGTIYLDDVTVGRTDSIPTSVARTTTPPRTTPSVTTAANEPHDVTPYSPINGTQFRSSVITFKWSGGALQGGETFVIEIIPTQANKSGCTADYGQAGLQYSPPLADHEWTTDINANPPPGKARPCPGRIEWRVHIRDAAGSVIRSTPRNYFEWNPL